MFCFSLFRPLRQRVTASAALVLAPLLSGCGGGASGPTASGLAASNPATSDSATSATSLNPAAASVAEASLPRSKTLRVACVGDSITFGVGVSQPKFAYPAILGQSLGKGYRVTNFGYSGATMLIASPLPYQRLPIYRQALAAKPDIVVVALGTNDAAMDLNAARRALFVKDYKKLIDDFRRVAGTSKIYLCIPPAAYGPSLGRAQNIRFWIAPLIRAIGQESGTPVIDLFSATSGKAELFPDSLHPNDAGARKLAAEIKLALVPS